MYIDYEKFGGRKAYLKTIGCQFLNSLGLYNHFKRIEWSRVERLIFVCTGNICRSPFAEACATLHGLSATSIGIDTEYDHPANSEAIIAAASFGVDLATHRSQPATALDFSSNDLILMMQPSHVRQFDQLIDIDILSQVTLLGLWQPSPVPYLQDPYERSRTYFLNCFKTIYNSVQKIANCIANNKETIIM